MGLGKAGLHSMAEMRDYGLGCILCVRCWSSDTLASDGNAIGYEDWECVSMDSVKRCTLNTWEVPPEWIVPRWVGLQLESAGGLGH
jgi:hypothetical protein